MQHEKGSLTIMPLEIPKNKIIYGDSLVFMKKIDNDKFDLVLTDPPYGIGESNEKNKSRDNLTETTDFGHYEWDKKRISKEYIDEILRISKNQIIFGGNYYTDYLPPSSCWIIWDKLNGNTDFADCEMAWTSFFDKATRKIAFRWQGMLRDKDRINGKEERVHPTQKPVPVFREILKKYSNKNDLILDPFCGSGTTCIASKQIGRNYVGIEKKKKYVKIARKRLKNTMGRKQGLKKYVGD